MPPILGALLDIVGIACLATAAYLGLEPAGRALLVVGIALLLMSYRASTTPRRRS